MEIFLFPEDLGSKLEDPRRVFHNESEKVLRIEWEWMFHDTFDFREGPAKMNEMMVLKA